MTVIDSDHITEADILDALTMTVECDDCPTTSAAGLMARQPDGWLCPWCNHVRQSEADPW